MESFLECDPFKSKRVHIDIPVENVAKVVGVTAGNEDN